MKLTFSFSAVDPYCDLRAVEFTFDLWSLPSESVIKDVLNRLRIFLLSIHDSDTHESRIIDYIASECVEIQFDFSQRFIPFHVSLISEFPEITLRTSIYTVEKCINLLKKDWNENKRKK